MNLVNVKHYRIFKIEYFYHDSIPYWSSSTPWRRFTEAEGRGTYKRLASTACGLYMIFMHSSYTVRTHRSQLIHSSHVLHAVPWWLGCNLHKVCTYYTWFVSNLHVIHTRLAASHVPHSVCRAIMRLLRDADQGKVKEGKSRQATVGQNQVVFTHRIIHLSMSLGVSEWASERMSVAERGIKASSVEQANEWAVRANKQMDERKRVAQYLRPDSWLIWTTVQAAVEDDGWICHFIYCRRGKWIIKCLASHKNYEFHRWL